MIPRVPRGKEVRGWTLEPEFTRRLAATKNLTTSNSSVIPPCPRGKEVRGWTLEPEFTRRLAATKNLTTF